MTKKYKKEPWGVDDFDTKYDPCLFVCLFQGVAEPGVAGDYVSRITTRGAVVARASNSYAHYWRQTLRPKPKLYIPLPDLAHKTNIELVWMLLV